MKDKFLNCILLFAVFSVLFTAVSISFVFSVSLYDFYGKVLPITLTLLVIMTGVYLGLLKYFRHAAEKMIPDEKSRKSADLISEKDHNLLEAEKRERIRMEMYSNISHEMKTPLTTIRGYAEMMENHMVPEKDIPDIAAKMNEESCRLISMIDRVMDSIRHPEMMDLGNNEIFDMKEAVSSVAERLMPRAKAKGISVYISGVPLLFDSNREIYEQICYNLIDNAIKYTKDGGVVRICVEETEKKKCLRISDNGIGISQEDQKRVFERFFRADRSHSRNVDGIGLGLSIVKRYADLLNAELILNSTLGKGTEICILFR